jgi:hypothetical protein
MAFYQTTPGAVRRLYAARVPQPIVDICTGNGLFLAGGALRDIRIGEPVKDYDLFASEESVYTNAVEVFRAWGAVESRTAWTAAVPNASRPLQVQLIKEWYGWQKEVLDFFDFTMSQFSWDPTDNTGYEGYSAINDATERRLVYTSPVRAEASLGGPLQRTLKFARRGWTIENEELAKVVGHLAHLPYEVLLERFRDNGDS